MQLPLDVFALPHISNMNLSKVIQKCKAHSNRKYINLKLESAITKIHFFRSYAINMLLFMFLQKDNTMRKSTMKKYNEILKNQEKISKKKSK